MVRPGAWLASIGDAASSETANRLEKAMHERQERYGQVIVGLVALLGLHLVAHTAGLEDDRCPPGTAPVMEPDLGFVGCAAHPHWPPENPPDVPEPEFPPEDPDRPPSRPRPDCPRDLAPKLIDGVWYCPAEEDEEEDEDDGCAEHIATITAVHQRCLKKAEVDGLKCVLESNVVEVVFKCGPEKLAADRRCEADKAALLETVPLICRES